MNVAFDPWIPVVTLSGERTLISLKDTFTEGGKYSDLAVRPHERVSLMRLFLCIAHAALDGPKDYDEWCEAPNRLAGDVERYLLAWKESFELFHENKPWLQIAKLTKKNNVTNSDPDSILDWTPVSKLNFSFATGNNSTLFDHEGMESKERNIPPHQVILSMIAFQCFSVGGLIGQVYWDGALCGDLANSKKDNGPVKSSDGPCVPSSMTHAFLRGENLLTTINLNTPTYEDVRYSYGEHEIGKPVWEMMPASLSDKEAAQNATRTYIGRLMPMSRLIRLHPTGQKMLIGNGFTFPFFSDGFPQEPSATVVRNNDKRILLSYKPSKAIWRELAAIVVKRKTDGTGGPLSLRAIQDGKGCDLIVSALARDKATIEDTMESVYHIPSQLISTEGNDAYQSEVKQSESLASRLGWAIEAYRKEIDGGWEGRLKGAGPAKGKLKAKLHSIATTHYWTAVEKNLPLLMRHIEAIGSEDAMPTRDAWRKMIFSTACEAFRIACGRETPRQIRAYSVGWQKLVPKIDIKDSESTNSGEEDA